MDGHGPEPSIARLHPWSRTGSGREARRSGSGSAGETLELAPGGDRSSTGRPLSGERFSASGRRGGGKRESRPERDTIHVTVGNYRVELMYAFPTCIPLSARGDRRIRSVLETWHFENIDGAWSGKSIFAGARRSHFSQRINSVTAGELMQSQTHSPRKWNWRIPLCNGSAPVPRRRGFLCRMPRMEGPKRRGTSWIRGLYEAHLLGARP